MEFENFLLPTLIYITLGGAVTAGVSPSYMARNVAHQRACQVAVSIVILEAFLSRVIFMYMCLCYDKTIHMLQKQLSLRLNVKDLPTF